MQIEKVWVETQEPPREKVSALVRSHKLSPVLATLLVNRGIDTPEKASEFFNPDLKQLHDPFKMKDMMVAVQRLDQAIRDDETIMIYGDYDVDGITAVSLVYLFLRQWVKDEDHLLFYIPDRYSEGYGISKQGLEYAFRNGVNLVISLDCGIKANERVDFAHSHGLDFIICDHHLPGDTLPNAVAVLDPKREDCSYPFDELSGCGVGFKLLQGFCMYRELPFSYIEQFLDLVAVSNASDIVPLTGENRILTYYGINILNKRPNCGLSAIIKISGLEKHPIQIDDIVFKIGPRLNAAGRTAVDSIDGNSGGQVAVELLTAQTEIEALRLVNRIDSFNQHRKDVDRQITEQAHSILNADPLHETRKCTVIFHKDWVKGVVGIVASRLIETYHRPTVVLTESGGFITGSARSIPGFDLYQAIENCSDLLENFGGHTYAAGLTMRPENYPIFKERFEKFVEEHINPNHLVQTIHIDSELALDEITPEFRRNLQRFQPFGPGNSSPTFISRHVVDSGDAKKFGAKMEHMKMELGQRDRSYRPVNAIVFSQAGEYYDLVKSGCDIDVCYSLVENHYQGITTPQLRIKDIKQSTKENY